MEPIQCSETSAFNTQTPGKYTEDILSGKMLSMFNYDAIWAWYRSLYMKGNWVWAGQDRLSGWGHVSVGPGYFVLLHAGITMPAEIICRRKLVVSWFNL
jgi:hypothetical protein